MHQTATLLSLEQCSILLEEVVKERNGGNADELVKLVRENQIILRKMKVCSHYSFELNKHEIDTMTHVSSRGNTCTQSYLNAMCSMLSLTADPQKKENIRQSVVQEVVKLVLQSDVDRDGYINKKEAAVLGKRLSMSMEVYGIVFDTEKFHRAVGLSPSICGVLTIVRHLLPDENNRVPSFYSIDSTDSDANNDRPKEEEEEEEKEEEKEEREKEEDKGKDDLYDMFYMPVEEYCHRGDAQAIHLCKSYCAMTGELPKLISIAPSKRRILIGLRSSVSSGDDCKPFTVCTDVA